MADGAWSQSGHNASQLSVTLTQVSSYEYHRVHFDDTVSRRTHYDFVFNQAELADVLFLYKLKTSSIIQKPSFLSCKPKLSSG